MKIDIHDECSIETEWPARIYIDQDTETLSLLASIVLSEIPAPKPWNCQVVKFVKKGQWVGLFVSPYSDADLPEWWQGAEILFEYKQSNEEK